jgi:hypothetical protein
VILKALVVPGFLAFSALFAQAPADPLLDWLSRGGAVGILAFFVIAFVRRWIVTGGELREMRAQRDRALELVYRQAGLTEKAVNLSDAQRSVLEEEVRLLRRLHEPRGSS